MTSRYNRLPLAAKRAEDLAHVREPAIACPGCDTKVMPVDLIAHLDERCGGPRDPSPLSLWVNWRAALGVVPERTLLRWVDRGRVRFKGGRGDRLYLFRDLAQHVAQRRVNRRR